VNNGVLVFSSISYPLMIDPQLQARKWIKKLEQENQLSIVKISSPDLGKTLERCVRMGQPMFVEDIQEKLEPVLESVLLKQFVINNRRKMVRIADSEVEFDPNFKLYLQSKLSNPEFHPDVFIKVTVINFTVT